MSEDALAIADRQPIGWYEEVIPVRGCHLSLENIKEVYWDLTIINRKFGEQVISTLPRDESMTEEQWAAHKAFLLNDAFCLTTKITGLRDQQLYGEKVELFDNPDIPKPIRSIFFTNVNSFKRHASGNVPLNRLEVFLDFGKPEVFDPNPLVSAATSNDGNVTVNAQDMTFFRAVQRVVETKLTNNRTWYSLIHRNFAYDLGLWVLEHIQAKWNHFADKDMLQIQ